MASPSGLEGTPRKTTIDPGKRVRNVREHTVLFDDADYTSRYPYNDTGRIMVGRGDLLDPFAALTFAAAHTSRIKLGTGICLVPHRNPLIMAKMVASLDRLSKGRFFFG